MEVSISDISGLSIAIVGPGPLGVDIEPVEPRDEDTWRMLLGQPRLELARQVAVDADETLDTAATRLWTIQEATKKANGLKPAEVQFEGSVGGRWLAFRTELGETPATLSSTCLEVDGQHGRLTACFLTPGRNSAPLERSACFKAGFRMGGWRARAEDLPAGAREDEEKVDVR